MAKFKTEKRKANVGERILITNAGWTFGDYDNGDVLTVVDSFGKNAVLVDGEDFPQITHEEYEVIVAETPTKPSYPERISLLESQVAELQAKVEALQKVKYVFGVDLAKPTPNEQRKAAIKRAKAFIEEAKVDVSISRGKGYVIGEIGRICDVQFIVNNDKRTVVALFRWRHDGNVYAKAIAKCAPDDVFNADIGKAIALGRALGLDVSEFENAVKPTEVVVGHKIRSLEYGDEQFCVTEISGVEARVNNTKMYYGVNRIDIAFRVTDDTDAEYV